MTETICTEAEQQYEHAKKEAEQDPISAQTWLNAGFTKCSFCPLNCSKMTKLNLPTEVLRYVNREAFKANQSAEEWITELLIQKQADEE